MIEVQKIKEKRRNYFMTDKEVEILWQAAKRWGSKFQVLLGLALFRGMRIGEIVACSIYDFQNENFQRLNIILEKSHIQDEFPIIKGFNDVLRQYVVRNRHLLKDGYLFPFYISRKKPHMDAKTAIALFAKLRKIIGKEYPQFLDRTEIKTTKGNIIFRYRIGLHSCRRWFETRIWERYKDKMLLRDIMRYKESKSVDVYINPYEVWKNEHEILENTFGSIFEKINHVSKGQMKITSFL